jgi:hypothetical protein
MSLIMRRPGNSKMEDTDSKWLRVIVYDTLMGKVDAVRILHPTWPGNTPDRQRYILMTAFRLAMARSGWDLKRDTH